MSTPQNVEDIYTLSPAQQGMLLYLLLSGEGGLLRPVRGGPHGSARSGRLPAELAAGDRAASPLAYPVPLGEARPAAPGRAAHRRAALARAQLERPGEGGARAALRLLPGGGQGRGLRSGQGPADARRPHPVGGGRPQDRLELPPPGAGRLVDDAGARGGPRVLRRACPRGWRSSFRGPGPSATTSGGCRSRTWPRPRSFWRRTLAGHASPTPLPFDGTGMDAAARPGVAGRGPRLRAGDPGAPGARAAASDHLQHPLPGRLGACCSAARPGCATWSSAPSSPAVRPSWRGSSRWWACSSTACPCGSPWTRTRGSAPGSRKLQASQIEQREYEHCPLEQIQAWCGLPRHVPLFESLLVFENYPVDAMEQRAREVRSMQIPVSARRTTSP